VVDPTEPVVLAEASVVAGLDHWRTLPIKQQPSWPDADAVAAASAELATQPPLVFAGEVDILRDRLAEAASGQPGANLRRLSQLCGGIDTAEILEEFEVRRIRSVGPATSVPSSQLGQLLPIPADLGRPA